MSPERPTRHRPNATATVAVSNRSRAANRAEPSRGRVPPDPIARQRVRQAARALQQDQPQGRDPRLQQDPRGQHARQARPGPHARHSPSPDRPTGHGHRRHGHRGRGRHVRSSRSPDRPTGHGHREHDHRERGRHVRSNRSPGRPTGRGRRGRVHRVRCRQLREDPAVHPVTARPATARPPGVHRFTGHRTTGHRTGAGEVITGIRAGAGTTRPLLPVRRSSTWRLYPTTLRVAQPSGIRTARSIPVTG
jgi:hypothetical protein